MATVQLLVAMQTAVVVVQTPMVVLVSQVQILVNAPLHALSSSRRTPQSWYLHLQLQQAVSAQ